MSILAHRGLLLNVGGGASLYDEIIGLSPTFYFRHAEPSGTTMVDEMGTDGAYTATTTLAQTAIYTGGPTCTYFTGANGGGDADPNTLAGATEMSLVTIMKPDAITGVKQIISRDHDLGSRYFQWRLNGSDMEFIKITGGVAVVARAHGMSAGTAYMVGVIVDSSGTVSLFVDGSILGSTGSVTPPSDWGTTSRTLTINRRASADATDNRFSESAGWNSALTSANMLTLAQAGGFA